MPTIEIKNSIFTPPNTLSLFLRHSLTYQQLLSLTGTVSQNLEKIAATEFSLHPGRLTKVPEIWFNLGKKYCIFLRSDEIIFQARHNSLDLNRDPIDSQIANIIKTSEY